VIDHRGCLPFASGRSVVVVGGWPRYAGARRSLPVQDGCGTIPPIAGVAIGRAPSIRPGCRDDVHGLDPPGVLGLAIAATIAGPAGGLSLWPFLLILLRDADRRAL
jgi:hypothetical protein